LMITNETLKIIKQRRSIRSYKAEQIKDEELQAMLEVGLYAPNAGDQAWHFTIVQNKALLDRLNLAAKEAAKQMDMEHLRALGNNAEFNCLYGAPTLILVSGNEQCPVQLDADCAAATENMLIAAESLGIGSCWIFFVLMAFMSAQGPELRKELKIPEGYRPYDAAVFGYKNAPAPKAPDRKPDLATYIR
jgi:nitroreductase